MRSGFLFCEVTTPRGLTVQLSGKEIIYMYIFITVLSHKLQQAILRIPYSPCTINECVLLLNTAIYVSFKVGNNVLRFYILTCLVPPSIMELLCPSTISSHCCFAAELNALFPTAGALASKYSVQYLDYSFFFFFLTSSYLFQY